jgi:hypothetical protein
MQRLLKYGISALALVAMLVVMPLIANAHEHRHVVDEKYELTVGFLEEPAFVGEKNGLSLRVVTVGEGDETEPVVGLQETLQAEVIFGDQSMPLELSPVFNDLGHYQSVFFPTAEGDYTFRVWGEIEGNAIDESFTSSPEGFDSVHSREPLEFPKAS